LAACSFLCNIHRGETAHEVVLEVRRQFEANPDIITYKAKPNYDRCVALVTEAALREMRVPGILCVATPILMGLTFRFVPSFRCQGVGCLSHV
jgi:Na+/H+-translocating membrane pyrophosphatase